MAAIEERTNSDGSVTYRAKVRIKGHPVQTASFSRKTDARNWARDTEVAIRHGKFFVTAEARKHTLSEAVERYSAGKARELKDAHSRLRSLSRWVQDLGPYAMSEITTARVREVIEQYAAEPSRRGGLRNPATVNRHLAALSALMGQAVKWGWLESNPVTKVDKGKESRGRVRRLTNDERNRLMAECAGHPDLRLAVALSLTTGARYGEVMGLTWADIDLASCSAILQDSKNGERRAIPLVEPALSLLVARSKIRRLDTNRIFPGRVHPNNPIDLRQPWEQAIKRAGITDFRWHDMRHDFASNLAMSGATLFEIADAMGHKSVQMVKRYAHLSNAHKLATVERMVSKVFGSSS
ncbi:site-specific integrase [Acidithiobacillus sp. VAN18-1]|uniref:Site-specific integrase n=1 Tax=Igneacidithiobacillus copahuensis TaxID=2724909 RepID=A0AAE3CJ16_9PROT|nr:site-specific integrase [Igneacidithiobacillus copahuensis]MBU2787326.1 site-specific integrase [Igneacidithiobacillus copahuensis]MBU2797345.1 site-specific integrase [Acidithiobacillus sp. VAN18-2]